MKMKRITWQRILAFVIVMTMLFELLPMTSFAVEDGSGSNTGTASISESARAELSVIGEVPELRDATSKQFRLSDGSYAAVEYGIPIHFQTEDNSWEEIDNTLTYADANGMYTSENGTEARGFADKLYLDQPVFVTQQDGYQVELSLMQQEEAVEEMPVNEPPSESEDELSEEIVDSIGNEEADMPTEDAAADEYVVEGEADIIVEEETIELEAMENSTLDDAEIFINPDYAAQNLTENEITAMAGNEVINDDVSEEPTEEGIPAIIINPGDGASVLNAGDAEQSLANQFAPDKLGSTVLYENVFDGVDLMYENYSYNIKEIILVNEPQSDYAYSFRLSADGLTPVLEEDGAVYLYDENDNPIYIIPAPYMYDANNILSFDVEYTLEADGNGYILTVSADDAWMNAEDRAYPVAIDPTVLSYSLYVSDAELYVTYVVQGNPKYSHAYADIHYIGYTQNKECWMYAYVGELPDLPAGCMLVDASFMLYQVSAGNGGYNGYSRLQLCAYPVTSRPSSGTYGNWIQNMTWNNRASYDADEMLDYAIASANTGTTYLEWDLTEEAERWYSEGANANRTFALVPYETGTFTSTRYANAAFFGYGSHRPPMMVFQYRSNIGLEDYYTYQSHGIGYAGTAYIGDNSGQLIITNTQAVNSSTVLPISLGLVYNSVYAGGRFEEAKNTGMYFGNGWKLDAVQQLKQVELDDTDYMLHIDGDGTYHYYAKEGSIWKDEDGLNLEIKSDKIYGSSGTSYKNGYSITTDKGAELSFCNGLLVQQTDQNGNAIRYLYNGAASASGTGWLPTSGSTNKITKIVQRNVGETEDLVLATLTYDSNGYLTKITDRAGNTYSYTFSGNKLTKITHSVGPAVEYTYQADGKLSTAADVSGKYRMTYTYGSDGRVSGYSESAKKDSSWVYGLAAAVTGNKEKTTYTVCGPDGVLDTDDDILTTCLFDDAGRTCNIYSANVDGSQVYGASVGKYTDTSATSGKNNRIETSAAIGTAAANWIRNGGFETENTSGGDDAKYWSFAGIQSGTNIVAKHDSHRTGTRSLKAWLTTASTESVSASQTITGLEVGQTYSFSAYVNTADAVSFNADGVYLTVNNGSGTVRSTPVNYKTTADIENGWTRIDVTFTAGTSNTVSIVVNGISGITYADDVQLEKGDAPSNVNLLSDGGMEYSGFWSGKNNGSAVGSGVSNSKAAKVTSNPLVDGYLLQNVPVNYGGANTFVLSGWAKADAMADNLDEDLFGERKNFGLKAVVNYTDGTEDDKEFYTPFNAEIRNEWQYASLIIIPTDAEKTVESIDVYCQYRYNNGVAYFDDLSLVKEAAQTMKYDEDGNVVSVATTGVDEDTSTYENGDLTKVVTSGSGTFEYDYDDKHNLTSATNGKITQTYEYTGAGNNKGTKLSGTGTSEVMKTAATYQKHGNLLSTVTDAQGATTQYVYIDDINDSAVMYGTPHKTIDPNGTAYFTSYHADGKVDGQFISGVVSAYNTYTDENLTKVTRGGYLPGESGAENKKHQEYNLYYNEFDQLTSVAVGTITLSENTYDDVGNLTDQDYGNGDWVSYTYDHLNRVKTESWSGGKDVAYFYSSEGYLSKKVDNDTGEEVNYTYDSLNRLIGSSQLDAGGNVVQRTEHQYDDSNRLSKQVWVLGGTLYSESFRYNDDGTLSYVDSLSGNFGDYGFTYDGLTRLKTQYNYRFRQEYTYRNVATNQTTSQISNIAYTKRDGGPSFSEFNLGYTYDALGNITTITNSANSADNRTYTYDVQGQMLTEKIGSKTYTYTYDTYGNIRKAVQNGTTHTYTYGDSEWRDLLTAYDGQTITYDKIGNPLSYYNGTRWAFDWENGRQMTGAESDEHEISYTYDMDGIRDSKTVDGVSYHYVTQNGKVVRQTWGNNTLDIIYDTNGNPYSFRYNNAYYVYVLNLQGDVIRIVNTNGATVAEYQYDAWGNVLEATGALASINPIRYRGYYYDTETGFYYLQSRYYDPSIGRFINADCYASTGQGFLGYNMFAYCGNNPVTQHDPSGNLASWASVAIGGAIGNIIVNAVFSPSDYSTVGGALKSSAISGTTGALGAVAGLSNLRHVRILICGTNGVINAASSASKGDTWLYSFFTGYIGTYFGTQFDLSEYGGFDAAMANGLFTMFTGGLTELAPPSVAELYTQVMTEWIRSSSYPDGHDSGIPFHLANGGSKSIGVTPLTTLLIK